MDSLASSDGVVDDEGNLFGVVNVVDALVLLLVVAVVTAGVGLVLSSGDNTEPAPAPETDTTFVTLDLGTQPDYIAWALDEGDTYAPTNASNLTITDIYLAPQGNQTRVLARAELEGTTSNGTLDYANAPPRLGRALDINTDVYNVTGRISDVGGDSSLNTSTTTVVLQETVSTADATVVTPGDEVTVAGRTTATVEDVAVYPTTAADERRILVEATLSTYTEQGVRRFGGTPVRPGQAVTLPAPGYTIDGRIDRVDSGLDRDSLTNRTVTLAAPRLAPEIAAVVRTGLTEQSGGQTTAYVTGVDVTPSPVVATTANGTVVTGDHPTRRDLTLTTELRVTETATGPAFRGERLQHGSTVVLDLGTVTVETTVVGLES